MENLQGKNWYTYRSHGQVFFNSAIVCFQKTGSTSRAGSFFYRILDCRAKSTQGEAKLCKEKRVGQKLVTIWFPSILQEFVSEKLIP